MANRRPLRPLPRSLAGLGENPNETMGRSLGVNSSRGQSQYPGVPTEPNPLAVPGLPESLVVPQAPVASKIELRKALEALALPNMSADHLEKIVNLVEIVGVDLIQRALAHYSIYFQAKPFLNYDIYNIPIIGAAQAVRLDVIGDDFRNRRALTIFNPSAADVLWVGKTDRVNATTNMGIPVATNNGSYMVAAHESLPHFGFCANNNTAIIAQYA